MDASYWPKREVAKELKNCQKEIATYVETNTELLEELKTLKEIEITEKILLEKETALDKEDVVVEITDDDNEACN